MGPVTALSEQYHFPNQYKNRCAPGTQFVYYRGTRRPGGKRAEPEYFGCGYIGEVWRDDTISESAPKKDWAWYCSLRDYMPFPHPVSSKMEGEFLEKIAKNHWSVGVRQLPQGTFDRIVGLAGLAERKEPVLPLPEIAAIRITEATEPLLKPRKVSVTAISGENDLPKGRYSRNAAPVGKRAEEIAHRFLQENREALGARNIRWLARDGITPGWDLQFDDAAGDTIAVEVKGTTGPAFGSIDITVNEWSAAEKMGDRFWLYLVANCGGTEPIIQRLQDPFRLLGDNKADLLPVVYRLVIRG
jgi:hypothetical protein